MYEIQFYKDKNGKIYYGEFSSSGTYDYVLPQVKNVKQNKNLIGLQLSWSKVSGATGYQMQEYENGKWTDLVSVKFGYSKNSIHNYTVTKKVTIRIRAYKIDKNGKIYYGLWSTTSTFKGVSEENEKK